MKLAAVALVGAVVVWLAIAGVRRLRGKGAYVAVLVVGTAATLLVPAPFLAVLAESKIQGVLWTLGVYALVVVESARSFRFSWSKGHD